jgi:hypothetical protein
MSEHRRPDFTQTVSEADIDWVVCTELNSSHDFREWMARRVFGQDEELTSLGAWRSVADSAGESDLLWLIDAADGARRLVMIENKIDAPAQPDQFERYMQRGHGYIKAGKCESFITVLLAPEKYRSPDSKDYEVPITYEALRDWLARQAGERSRYLASLVEQALRKQREKAPPDAEITDFRRRIWRLAEDEFPELGVQDPGEVSASQYWVYMEFGEFRIIYKMYRTAGRFGDCVVDLELPGRLNDVDRLRAQFAGDLAEAGIQVVATGKSASFRKRVPRVEPPHFDETAVRGALSVARSLLTWWRHNGVL